MPIPIAHPSTDKTEVLIMVGSRLTALTNASLTTTGGSMPLSMAVATAGGIMSAAKMWLELHDASSAAWTTSVLVRSQARTVSSAALMTPSASSWLAWTAFCMIILTSPFGPRSFLMLTRASLTASSAVMLPLAKGSVLVLPSTAISSRSVGAMVMVGSLDRASSMAPRMPLRAEWSFRRDSFRSSSSASRAAVSASRARRASSRRRIFFMSSSVGVDILLVLN